MAQTLSEALHARLDSMGAEPRANAPIVDDEPEMDLAELDDGTLPETEDDESENAVLAEEPDDTEDEDATTVDEPTETDAASTRMKVKELAEAIGWDVKDLYNDLIVPFGNGESMTLGELKNDRDQLIQQRAEVENARAQIQQQTEQLQQYQQQVMAGSQAVSQEITDAQGEMRGIEAQYTNVDWDKLEENDPGRAANLRQKFATAYAQAQSKLSEAETKHQQQSQQQMQQMVQAHNQKLLEVVPEWRDQATYQEEAPQIYAMLQQTGFAPQEIQNIFDYRARLLARKAWLWDKHQGSVEAAKTKVRQAPKKVLRPGQSRTGKDINDRKVAALESQARTTGRRDDRMAAARAIVQSSNRR